MTDTEKLDIINKRCPYNVHNGITVTKLGEGFCEVEAELRPESLNPRGIAHGGFVYSLCDAAAGVAVNQDGRISVTLNGSVHYLRPSTGKMLRAEGRIIKNGRTVVLVCTDVYDDADRLTARGEFELYITEDKQ